MNQNDGLWVFVSVVACNVLGLLFDMLLQKTGFPMVTDIARRNPIVASLIVSVNALGVAGLAYHFWAKNGGK